MWKRQPDGVTIERLEFSGSNVKTHLLPWQARGLSYTASGYGKKIPTPYMVHHNGRWMRVYCICYSNVGTVYIVSRGQNIIVNIEE